MGASGIWCIRIFFFFFNIYCKLTELRHAIGKYTYHECTLNEFSQSEYIHVTSTQTKTGRLSEPPKVPLGPLAATTTHHQRDKYHPDF